MKAEWIGGQPVIVDASVAEWVGGTPHVVWEVVSQTYQDEVVTPISINTEAVDGGIFVDTAAAGVSLAILSIDAGTGEDPTFSAGISGAAATDTLILSDSVSAGIVCACYAASSHVLIELVDSAIGLSSQVLDSSLFQDETTFAAAADALVASTAISSEIVEIANVATLFTLDAAIYSDATECAIIESLQGLDSHILSELVDAAPGVGARMLDSQVYLDLTDLRVGMSPFGADSTRFTDAPYADILAMIDAVDDLSGLFQDEVASVFAVGVSALDVVTLADTITVAISESPIISDSFVFPEMVAANMLAAGAESDVSVFNDVTLGGLSISPDGADTVSYIDLIVMDTRVSISVLDAIPGLITPAALAFFVMKKRV